MAGRAGAAGRDGIPARPRDDGVDLALDAVSARMAFNEQQSLFVLTLHGATASVAGARVGEADIWMAHTLTWAIQASRDQRTPLKTVMWKEELRVELDVWGARFYPELDEGQHDLELQVWPTSVLGPRDAESIRRLRESSVAADVLVWANPFGTSDTHLSMMLPASLAKELSRHQRALTSQSQRKHHRRAMQQTAQAVSLLDCSDIDMAGTVGGELWSRVNEQVFTALMNFQNGTLAELPAEFLFDYLVTVMFNDTSATLIDVESPHKLCAWGAMAAYGLANSPIVETTSTLANVTAALQMVLPSAMAYLNLSRNSSAITNLTTAALLTANLGQIGSPFVNLAGAGDGSEAAGLVLLLPYAAMTLSGYALLYQTYDQVAGQVKFERDELLADLQLGVSEVQAAVTRGLLALGDLSDLYSSSPETDALIGAAFQNRIAIGSVVQANSAALSVFDLSRSNWTVRTAVERVPSPWLGAWTAWEEDGAATLEELKLHATKPPTQPWGWDDVTDVAVESALWADANNCSTWGITWIKIVTKKGSLDIGRSVNIESFNCTSCYHTTSVHALIITNGSAQITGVAGKYASTNPNRGVAGQLGLTFLNITTSDGNVVSLDLGPDPVFGSCAAEESSFEVDLSTDGAALGAGGSSPPGWICGLSALPPGAGAAAGVARSPFVGPLRLEGCYEVPYLTAKTLGLASLEAGNTPVRTLWT